MHFPWRGDASQGFPIERNALEPWLALMRGRRVLAALKATFSPRMR